MKKNIIILFLLFVTVFAFSEINKKILSGKLTKEFSPYYINENVIVPKDSVLVIEPGTTILFQGNYSLEVNGKILAIGVKNDSIYFVSLKKEGWNGVYLYQKAKKDTSVFTYCNFSKANTHNPAYKTEKSALTVNHYNFVKISDCSFYSNKANYGGAISVFNSNILIKNSVFKYNFAGFLGGAIVINSNSFVKIFNSIFEQNSSDYYAGAIYIDKNSYLTIANTLLDRNGATTGGAIVIKSSSLNLLNTTITANNANYSGGIDISEKSDVTIINTILWGNVAAENDNLEVDKTSSVDIKNSIIEREDIAQSLDNVHYENIIYKNPKFMLSGKEPFSLSEDSPAINKGFNELIKNIIPQKDLSGNPRVADDKIDIGAYEKNKNAELKLADFKLFFLKYNLSKEKFEGTIKFNIKKTTPIIIKIYSPDIKLINKIKVDNPKKGDNVIIWDGKSLSKDQMTPGVYFYKILQINN